MKITIDRSTVEQALKALSLALSDVDWRANSPTQPVIHKAHTALKAAQAEPVQLKEHCLWARNGNEPCPHVQQAEPVQELPWLRAIDEAMIDHHVGVADPADDYETAKRKLNNLLCHAQDIGAYFAKQAEPVQEPVAYIHRQGRHWEASERPLTDDEKARGWTEEPLYTAPPQRPAEPTV
jgi:hypothetical protein